MTASSRQKDVGVRARAQTRERLLAAAAVEFANSGYAGATVTRIAQRAGVTVQTLYLAWGSKRELLRGHARAQLAGGDDPTTHFAAALAAAGSVDAVSRVEAIAVIFADVAARAAGVWQLHRDAAAVDAAIANDWQELQLLRRHTTAMLVETIPQDQLIEGAADTAWVVASPESYDLLVTRAGYSPDRYRDWLRTTLCAAILR